MKDLKEQHYHPNKGGSKFALQILNTIVLFVLCGGAAYIGNATIESSKAIARIDQKLEELRDIKDQIANLNSKTEGLEHRVTKLETKSGL